MEEDIMILEKYIDEKEGALKIWQIETINECEDLRVAIQNLIARYKELEEKNLMLTNSYFQVTKEIEVKPKTFDYIPKSKVQEKIIYYQNLYKQDNSPNEFLIGQDCLSKLSILQKLLDE